MSAKAPRLALLGGKPVRARPFASSVVVDGAERREVLSVLAAKEFSRFMGSPTPDIKAVLRMPSREAARYSPQYFTFLGGRKVRGFERGFAARFKVPFAVSMNSATSALSAAVGALGVEPGDEIITTPLSFNATATSVLAFNAVPVFADVSPRNFCLDPGKIEARITPRTKAVLVVHLLGFPADMDSILDVARRRRLRVIEDCAQAPGTLYKGRPVGTLGDIGVFSFQETKNMMTGEGGMAATSDPELAARLRLIRNHGESIPDEGWGDDELVNLVGFNFRMTELTAALGIAQLGKLAENNRARTANARRLAARLEGLPGLEVPRAPAGTVYHVLPLLYDSTATGVPRVNIVHALRAEGIPVGTGYARLMYENPLFLRRVAFGSKGFPFSVHGVSYRRGDCPAAEDLVSHRFLWFYHIHRPNASRDMDDAARAFRKVFSSLDALKSWRPGGRALGYKW